MNKCKYETTDEIKEQIKKAKQRAVECCQHSEKKKKIIKDGEYKEVGMYINH